MFFLFISFFLITCILVLVSESVIKLLGYRHGNPVTVPRECNQVAWLWGWLGGRWSLPAKTWGLDFPQEIAL